MKNILNKKTYYPLAKAVKCGLWNVLGEKEERNIGITNVKHARIVQNMGTSLIQCGIKSDKVKKSEF
jgi:hypothetical protein